MLARSVPALPPIIDFHCHVLPPGFALPRAKTKAGGPDWRRIGALMADEAALIAGIDDGDLGGRVVNAPAALLDRPRTPELDRDLNDAVSSLVARHPGKLVGLASVDAFSGASGAAEVRRAVTELGLRGIFVDSAKDGRLLDAPEARPALAAAHALGVPVFVHPVNPPGLTEQLAPYGRFGTFLARGTVNAASLVALIASGVFEELPGLNVVVTTLAIGGVLLAGAFSDGARLTRTTAEALRRHVYIDTMGLSPILIRAAVDLLGADHVLAGTDWPIVNDGPVKPGLTAALATAGLSAADRAAIASGNARRLLGLA